MGRRHGKNKTNALKAIAAADSGYTVIVTKDIYDILKSMKGVDVNWANIPKPSGKITGRTLAGILYDEYDDIKERW